MFCASAKLQTQSAEKSCEENNEDWQNFEKAAHGALNFLNDQYSDLQVHSKVVSLD